jgi:hypothetical protein
MAKSKPDDPFDDDFWGPGESTSGPEAPVRIPRPSDNQYVDWLKPHMLSSARGTMQLLRVGKGTEFSDIVLFVEVDKKQYRIGLRDFSKEFKACFERFGDNYANWKGTLEYRSMPAENYVSIRPAK